MYRKYFCPTNRIINNQNNDYDSKSKVLNGDLIISPLFTTTDTILKISSPSIAYTSVLNKENKFLSYPS